MVAASSYAPRSRCATALAQSSSAETVLCLFPLGSELQDGDNTCTPSPFSLFTDTTLTGGMEMRNGTTQSICPPRQNCACSNVFASSVQWEGEWAHGAGSTMWGSQLVNQKAIYLSVAEPPLPSESSISTGHPPWSSHGQPLTWKGSTKAHAKRH